MEKLDNQALTRFERSWKIEGDKLLKAGIIPLAVKDGEIYSVDCYISATTWLIQQLYGVGVVCGIRSVLLRLLEATDTQSTYPDESLHTPLPGCTQRKNTNIFERVQTSKIKRICIKEVEKKELTEIILGGIGTVGNQILTQGFPQNRSWEELRILLGEESVSPGEFLILYEDRSPVYMNIVRIVDATPHVLVSPHRAVSQLRDVELGTVKLQTVESVTTDFRVTKKNTVWLCKTECRNLSEDNYCI